MLVPKFTFVLDILISGFGNLSLFCKKDAILVKRNFRGFFVGIYGYDKITTSWWNVTITKTVLESRTMTIFSFSSQFLG